jgi:hypothetical protein
MLNDPYAELEIKKILSKKYEGQIKKLEIVNFNPEKIV